MERKPYRRDPRIYSARELETCRVCGCTELQACTWFEVLGDGRTTQHACHWVVPGLCSACAQPTPAELASFMEAEPPSEPLLVDHAGRPLVLR